MKTFKILPLILSAAFFLFILNSCKKTDQGTQTAGVSNADLADRLNAALINNPQMGQVVVPINEKVASSWTDITGNKIIVNNNNRALGCLADNHYPEIETLISVGVEYDCVSGYRYTFNWKISSPVKLSTISSLNGNRSHGNLRLKNASGAITYQEQYITPVIITYLGNDPNPSNTNRLYSASFTSKWISAAKNDKKYLSNNIEIYTECDELYSLTSAFTNNNPINVNLLNPLSRIDPLVIQSATASGKAFITGFGYYIGRYGCMSPGNGNFADRQRVELLYTGDPKKTWKAISPREGVPSRRPGSIGNSNLYTKSGPGYLYPLTTGTVPGKYPIVYNKNQTNSIATYDIYDIPDWDLFQNGSSAVHGNYLIRWCNEMTPTYPKANTFGPYSSEYKIVL